MEPAVAGKPSPFTKEQKDLILKQAIEFWDTATKAQSDFFDAVNEYERLTRCLLPEELEDKFAQYPDRSCLVPADIYNNLCSLRGHIRKALFNKKPYIKLHIEGEHNVVDERSKKAEHILQAIMDAEAEGKGFPSEAMKAIHQALYAGVSCVYTQWARRYRKSVNKGEDGSMAVVGGAPSYTDEIAAEYPETISVDIRRCRIDPSASERRDIRIVGFHSVVHFTDLVRLRRNPSTHYDFDETALFNSSFNRQLYFEYVKSEAEAYPYRGDDNRTFGDKPIEVLSIRGIFRFVAPDGTVDFKDLMVEIGNRKILLAVKENTLPLPSYAFFDFPAIDQQHGRLFTMGVVEPVRDTFLEMFVKKNQSLDSANYNTHSTVVVDSGAGQNLPDYIESGGDQLLKLDLSAAGFDSWQQAIGYLQRPPLGQDTFQHSQVLAREVQQGMKLSDYMQGKDPSAADTATAVDRLVSGGLNLTDEVIDQLTDTYLSPVSQKKLILWNFFQGDKPHKLVTKDSQVLTVQPWEIDLPYRVSIQTNISQTNPARARRFVEVFPVISQDRYFDPAVVRETLVDLLELPNGERLLLSDDLLEMTIDRENAALGLGAMLPVHPLDNHVAHLEGHQEYIDWIEQNSQAGLSPEIVMQHMEEHAQYIAEMQSALGNTKELGGNAGNDVQPQAGATPGGKQLGAPTGAYLPSGGRK